MHNMVAPGGTGFNFNGDFSGEIYVNEPDTDDGSSAMEGTARIPFEDLLWFLGYWAERLTENMIQEEIDKIDNRALATFVAAVIKDAVVSTVTVFPAPKLAPGAAPGGLKVHKMTDNPQA